MANEFDNVVSNLQAARDRLMPKVMGYFGDAFDGDFDSMLDAINAMKRYQQNIDKDREIFRDQSAQKTALLEAAKRVISHRIGDLPNRGDLRDNNESRQGLAALAAAIALAQGKK